MFGLDALPTDLQSGQSMRFRILAGMGDGPTMRVTVQWMDSAGSHKEPYMLLTF